MVAILSPTAEYSTFITVMQQMTADCIEKSDWQTFQTGSTLIWSFHALLPSKALAKGHQTPLTHKIISPLPPEQYQAIISTFVHKQGRSTYPNRMRLLSTVTHQATRKSQSN